MYGPARSGANHLRRVQRRRARLANPAARRVPAAAVVDPAATAAAWTPPAGVPAAVLTTSSPEGAA